MVSAVSRFVSTLVDICLLRAGPQDLPYSPNLLVLSLLAYTALGTKTASLGLPQVNPYIFSVINLLSLLFFAWFVLSLKGYYSRFNQTVIALFGTEVILGLLAWVLLAWQLQATDSGRESLLASVLYLALILWSLAINANIVRHALSITMAWAWGVSLAYFFIYMAIIRLITVGIAQGNS